MQLVAYLPSSAHVKVGEILESMRRWEQSYEDCRPDERRRACRYAYDGWIAIVTPVDPELGLFSVPTNVCAFLRGRNISKSGIGVIGSSVLEPAEIADYTPLLNIEQLLRMNCLCSVGLPSGDGLNLTWVSAEVVRTRNAQTDLVELGFQFVGRQQAGCSAHKDAEQLFWQLRESKSRLQDYRG